MGSIMSRSEAVANISLREFRSKTVTKIDRAIRVDGTIIFINNDRPNEVYVAQHRAVEKWAFSASGNSRWIGEYIEALGAIGVVGKKEVAAVLKRRAKAIEANTRKYNRERMQELAKALGVELTKEQLKQINKGVKNGR